MTCQQVTEFLGEYLDGGLSLSRRIRFKFHLALCRDCRRYLTSYGATILLAREAGQQVDLPPLPEDLVQAVLRTQRLTEEHVTNPSPSHPR